MNALDFVILVLIAIGALYGLSRGALRMATTVISLVSGIYFASLYYVEAGRIVTRELALTPVLGAVAGYVAVFTIVFFVIETVGRIAERIIRTVHLGWIDRIAGGAIGLGIASALAGLCLMLLTAILPANAALLTDSEMAPHLLACTSSLVAYIPSELHETYAAKKAELYRYWLDHAVATTKPGPYSTATATR